MLCYCKHEIEEGDRRLELTLRVDWGDEDEREDTGKVIVFDSFACIAQWAWDRSAQHDGHVVTSPAESHEDAAPVVDETTDTVIRGGAR